MQIEPVEKITRMPRVGDIITIPMGGCYTNNSIDRYAYLAEAGENVSAIVFDDWDRQFLVYPVFFQTTEENVGDLGLPIGEELSIYAKGVGVYIPNEHKDKFLPWISKP